MEKYFLYVLMLKESRLSEISSFEDLDLENEVGRQPIPGDFDGEAIEEAYAKVLDLRNLVATHNYPVLILPVGLYQNKRLVKQYSLEDLPEDLREEINFAILIGKMERDTPKPEPTLVM